MLPRPLLRGTNVMGPPAEQERVGALVDLVDERHGLVVEVPHGPSAALESAAAVLVPRAVPLHHSIDGDRLMQGHPLADDFSGHRGSDRAPAPGGLRLVEEFVNTISGLRGGVDLIAEPDGLAAWLNSRGIALDGTVDDADARRAVVLREAVRAWLSGPGGTSGEAVVAIERAAMDARLVLRPTDGDVLRLVTRAGGVDGALGTILIALYEGVVDGAAKRLRVCRNPACRWVFYDHSRNGAARWCSMKVCGSRAKAREYRRRRSADGGRQ
jgi:predicted RNA-binding Zn ribbon-like protein